VGDSGNDSPQKHQNQWLLKFSNNNLSLSWGEFFEALVAHFNKDSLVNYEIKLYKVRQFRSLNDYIDTFDNTLVKVSELVKINKVKCFVASLENHL
jgi:hypothetical protein